MNPIKESSITPEGIKLKAEIDEETQLQFAGAKEICGVGVICYFNPAVEGKEYFQLSGLRKSPVEIIDKGELETEIPFNTEDRKIYNSYLNSILYFTLVLKDITGTPVRCTANYKREFTHEVSVIKESFPFRDSRP
jgi:hypothetical protein